MNTIKLIFVTLVGLLLTWSACQQRHAKVNELCLRPTESFLEHKLEKDVVLLKKHGFRYDPNSSRPEKEVFLSTQFIDDVELGEYVGIRAVYLTYINKELSEIHYSYLLDINGMKELLPNILSTMDSKEKFECFNFLELLNSPSVERKGAGYLIELKLSRLPTNSHSVTYVLKIDSN